MGVEGRGRGEEEENLRVVEVERRFVKVFRVCRHRGHHSRKEVKVLHLNASAWTKSPRMHTSLRTWDTSLGDRAGCHRLPSSGLLPAACQLTSCSSSLTALHRPGVELLPASGKRGLFWSTMEQSSLDKVYEGCFIPLIKVPSLCALVQRAGTAKI
eukprot:10435-Hanusia_phi.AAC.2